MPAGTATLTAGLTRETLAALNASQGGSQPPFLIVPPSEPSSSSLRSAGAEPLPQVRRLAGSVGGQLREGRSTAGSPCLQASSSTPCVAPQPTIRTQPIPQVWQGLFACTRSAQSDAFLDSLACRPPLPPPAGLRPLGGQRSAAGSSGGAAGTSSRGAAAELAAGAGTGAATRSSLAADSGNWEGGAAAPTSGTAEATGESSSGAEGEDPTLGISRDTLFDRYLSPEALVQRHRLGKAEVRRLYQGLQVSCGLISLSLAAIEYLVGWS